jgi:photosystem II stability/assembly factor-like uncharacterized protein
MTRWKREKQGSALSLTILLGIGLISVRAQAQSPAEKSQAAAQPPPAVRPLPPPAMQSVKALEKQIAALKAAAKARAAEKAKHGEKAGEEDRDSRHIKGRPIENEAEENGTDFLEAYLYDYRQRAYPNDSIDWSAYDRAYAHRARMAPARMGRGSGIRPLSIGGAWEFVGPQNLPVPYRVYYGVSPIIGRVNALAFDPASSGTFYLGSATGGVWKTTDSGTTWKPLSDSWPSLQTSSIAIDPRNHNTIYVGTGDFDGYGGYGFGIMKSTDGGATWTNRGNTQFGAFAVSAIVVDPENSNIVTVTVGRPPNWWGYIWRSTDGGATWTAVNTTYAPWSDIKYGAKDGSGTRHYYATGHYYGGQVWRSDDRGATWTQLFPPLSNINWYDQNSLEIAASPTNPNTVYLIGGFDMKLFKSIDAGATWTDISAGFPDGHEVSSNYNWSQSGYDVALNCSTRTVNGNPVDVVYASLIDLDQSPDGGATWQSLGGPTYTGSSVLHNDQHCVAINPNNPSDLLVGCDGGVFRLAYDPNANTWAFTSLNIPLGITQFYALACHPTDPIRLLGGTQDNATPALLGGSPSNWGNVAGGDGGFCDINPLTPDTQYASSQNLSIYETTNNWASENYISSSDFQSDNRAFIAPLVLDKTDPTKLYAATDYLYRRDDSSGTWTGRLGPGFGQLLSSTGYVQAIAVSPTNDNTIYTGSADGEVWMTTDAGASWTQINPAGGGGGTVGLPNFAITSISVSPADPNNILVGLSGTGTTHLWQCGNTTAGAARTWTSVSGAGASSLPDIPLNAIARDVDAPLNTWYVGTDVGVFMSKDQGATWQNATQPLGLPNVRVNALAAVPGTRYLNAGTFGRGVWRIKMSGVKVSGTITLQGAVNSAQPITFEFRPTGGTKFTSQQTLQANGAFSFSDIPPGTYTLHVKGSKWLARNVTVDASHGDVSGVNATLLPGDINNDNKVNIADLGLLADSFGRNQGQTGFNPNADLNGDNKVNITDLGLLADSFGKSGDP